MGKFIRILLTFIIILASTPVFAGNFKVYSADAYKELSKINKAPTRFYGEAVELLVDYSGSMYSWVEVAKEALNFIMPSIPKNTAVAVRVFGGDIVGNPSSQNYCTSSNQISAFRKRNSEAVKNGLNSVQVGGSTPIEFALREAVEKDLKNVSTYDKNTTRKTKKIILVTDGYENCGGNPCAYIREVMRKRKDIKIDVIQLGNGRELACLADATGGTFYEIDGSKKRFENVFEIVFEVPKGTIAEKKYPLKEYKPQIKTVQEKKPPVYKQNQKLGNKYRYVKY